jgi:catechol 2,3-dioxygenase-like lactoylglutathione lyase family enzyme
MRARSFSHTGVTVSDFNRAVKFWYHVFGAPLVGVTDAPADRVKGFFGVPSGGTCKIGWIRVPGGGVIEIFHFEPQLPPHAVEWNRRGQTHICLNVRGIRRWYGYLAQQKEIEIVGPPERSPRGHWLFFVRDFDGNLIEITDLGHMYYVLGWLGPLGGFLFRRGRYQQYYR